MKHITILAIIILTFISTGCANKEQRAIRHAVERQMEYYPKSTLLDLYKSFFQDNFGPGHIVNDTAAARRYIEREIANATEYDRHYYEPAGRGENFYRVSLATVSDSIVPMEVFCEAFFASVKDIKPVDIKEWQEEWAHINEIIGKMKLNLPDYEKDSATLDSLLNAGEYAYHHSHNYTRLYSPHYRLIKKEIFLKDIKPLIDSTRIY